MISCSFLNFQKKNTGNGRECQKTNEKKKLYTKREDENPFVVFTFRL